MDRLTVWEKVIAEFDGRLVSGSFAVDQGMVKVKTLKGQGATQVGVFNTTWLARYLLRELAAEERRKEKESGRLQGGGGFTTFAAIRRTSFAGTQCRYTNGKHSLKKLRKVSGKTKKQ